MATLLGALVIALGVTPAFAAPRERTGDRINLFVGDTEYPAGAPFYIAHGIGAILGEDTAIGRGSFVLEVDGATAPASYMERDVADGMLTSVSVFNFPAGMSGTHTFTGHWFAACGAPTGYLACGDNPPNTPLEFETLEVVVTFIE